MIENLVWVSIGCELLSSRFRISSSSAEVAAAIEALLPSSTIIAGDFLADEEFFCRELEDRSFCLFNGDDLVAHSTSWRSLLDVLLVELNRVAIARFEGLAIHAGVVADDGVAIAFPGSSGSGKSTIVAACLSAGLGYVSDEALCVDLASGRVLPYPKPLRLTSGGYPVEGPSPPPPFPAKSHIAPADLGSAVASDPLPLAHVVRIVRRPGPVCLTEARPAEAAGWLLALAFNHYKRPEVSFRVVTDMARDFRAWHLEYEEAVPATDALLERLCRRSR